MPLHQGRTIAVMLKILWALPWTCFGLALALATLPWGCRITRVGRVIECYGPGISWLLVHAPLARGAYAITFGHTVLGRDRDEIERTRAHERVHVRQYERWGPFFIPAYLLCWLVLSLRGEDGYWQNPFEREAYNEAP